MKVTDGKTTIDLSIPQKAIDGKLYQAIEQPTIHNITPESNPTIWALLQPKN